MIKQTWEISNEERNRILSLHESATKNFYLMSEQDVVQGPGGPSTFYDQDENYRYYISQPTYSVGSGYADYKKLYFLYAMGTEGSFQCKITSKNEKGQPTSFEVLTDKPLPVLSNNPDINQFQFEMIKLSKKEYKWGRGNELTTNAFIGKEMEGRSGEQYATGGQYFAVFDAKKGKPETVVIKEEKSGTYKDYNINFDELEVGSTTLFNPSDEGFYSRFIGQFSLYMPTLKSSYPIDPEDFKVPTPSETPEFEEIKLDIQSPFEFDKTTLTSEAEIEFKKFIEKVKSNYQGVSGNVEVIASASIDGDENQKRDYNQKLSDNRASTISNRLKTETGISTLNFIPKGIGQTDQFAKGMKYPEVKDVNQTAPNRRLIIKMPTLTKEKQK
jgi:outer membrane protein OmpA-like peptidoglycan-associated protein